jgi:hypothetical protein
MEFHDDTSRLDAFLKARQRAAMLHAAWRPILAGALASLAVSAAIFAVLPRFSVRDVEVPRVTFKDADIPHIVPKDVEVDHVIPKSVEIEIPRLVAPRETPAPTTPEAFAASPEYKSAEISGIIAGPYKNGFRLENGGVFTPAHLINGHPEEVQDVYDDITGLIGQPAYCSPLPSGLYACRAWRPGTGVVNIPVRPIGKQPSTGAVAEPPVHWETIAQEAISRDAAPAQDGLEGVAGTQGTVTANADPGVPAAIIPDPTLTPGAVRTTDVADICSTPTRELRHWSRERDDRILTEYGLPPGPHPDWEVDHLVPLCLGGADADSNLWPEPRRSIEPEWPAEKKDDLEHRLCEMVCAGELDVRVAQEEISEDWPASYLRWFRRAAR